jgi:predicted NAD/FAD-dependent oxidoreductase
LVEAVDDVILNASPSWSSEHYADERLKRVLQDLVDSAHDAGCSEDLTVVSAKYVEYLREALPRL